MLVYKVHRREELRNKKRKEPFEEWFTLFHFVVVFGIRLSLRQYS